MILDKTFPPDPRVENEAISLIDKGHEVFLFCLKYDNGIQDSVINGIKVKRYKSNMLEYKLSALAYTFPFYTFLMQRKIVHFLKEFNIEAIHIHDIRIAEAVLKANKKLKLKTVLDLHDNMPEIMKLYPPRKSTSKAWPSNSNRSSKEPTPAIWTRTTCPTKTGGAPSSPRTDEHYASPERSSNAVWSGARPMKLW